MATPGNKCELETCGTHDTVTPLRQFARCSIVDSSKYQSQDRSPMRCAIALSSTVYQTTNRTTTSTKTVKVVRTDQIKSNQSLRRKRTLLAPKKPSRMPIPSTPIPQPHPHHPPRVIHHSIPYPRQALWRRSPSHPHPPSSQLALMWLKPLRRMSSQHASNLV